MPGTVRAVALVAPRTYRLVEYPKPRLEPGSLLVRNLLSGISGTGQHTFQGYPTQYSGTDSPVEVRVAARADQDAKPDRWIPARQTERN